MRGGLLLSNIGMEQTEINNIENLEQERKELRLLINEGVAFTVTYFAKVRKGGWWHRLFTWLLRKQDYTFEERKRSFVVKEPTAFTLDRLSAEYIELAIDEAKVKEAPRQEARRLYAKHSRRMARIVAIAVLGNQWENKAMLKEHTEFFSRWLKNSQLWELVQAIDLTNNLADFINSMRLLSSARTTMPTRIENPQG